MKNLNKKIGVILLSGLVLAGGSLASSPSVAHASSSNLSFQEQVDLGSIEAYGEKAGFKVISSNSDEARKAEELDKENSSSFGSASELCDYINIIGQDLSSESYYKASVGDLKIIIKVGSEGIKDVDPEY